jgi:hypothetical protein
MRNIKKIKENLNLFNCDVCENPLDKNKISRFSEMEKGIAIVCCGAVQAITYRQIEDKIKEKIKNKIKEF